MRKTPRHSDAPTTMDWLICVACFAVALFAFNWVAPKITRAVATFFTLGN